MVIPRRYRVLRRRRARRACLFRQRTRVDDFRDEDFFCRFNFERATVLFLIDLLSPFIAPLSSRNISFCAGYGSTALLCHRGSLQAGRRFPWHLRGERQSQRPSSERYFMHHDTEIYQIPITTSR